MSLYSFFCPIVIMLFWCATVQTANYRHGLEIFVQKPKPAQLQNYTLQDSFDFFYSPELYLVVRISYDSTPSLRKIVLVYHHPDT